jgi:hypothetical protein
MNIRLPVSHLQRLSGETCNLFRVEQRQPCRLSMEPVIWTPSFITSAVSGSVDTDLMSLLPFGYAAVTFNAWIQSLQQDHSST